MNWTSAFQLATAVIASLGGGSAITYGLSSYLGKRWADRALEKEKHKYSDILQAAKAELDRATNLYQVQLDALGHIHTLRTDEEFVRLGNLWKKMAILQRTFDASCGMGLKFIPADKEEAEKYRAVRRKEYEDAFCSARDYFFEEKLFIPVFIANFVDSTLMYSYKEQVQYITYSGSSDPNIRQYYMNDLPDLLTKFNSGMEDLEKMMRGHIKGEQIGGWPTQA